MRKILLAAVLAMGPSPLFAQAVIIPSPVPALAPGCMLQRNPANTAWLCISAAGISQPLSDALGLIEDSTDPTKVLRFEVSAVSPGTTRIWTIPNADVVIPATIAALTANTFQGVQAFGSGFTASTGDVAGALTADGGNRVLSVAGGFPGNTSMFLRADGTFVAPPGALMEDMILQLMARVAELERELARLRDR